MEGVLLLLFHSLGLSFNRVRQTVVQEAVCFFKVGSCLWQGYKPTAIE